MAISTSTISNPTLSYPPAAGRLTPVTAVVIMSVQDFIRTAAPPPAWLQKAWTGAKRRGLGTLTPADVDSGNHRAPAQTGPRHPRSEMIRAVIDTNVLVSGLSLPRATRR